MKIDYVIKRMKTDVLQKTKIKDYSVGLNSMLTEMSQSYFDWVSDSGKKDLLTLPVFFEIRVFTNENDEIPYFTFGPIPVDCQPNYFLYKKRLLEGKNFKIDRDEYVRYLKERILNSSKKNMN